MHTLVPKGDQPRRASYDKSTSSASPPSRCRSSSSPPSSSSSDDTSFASSHATRWFLVGALFVLLLGVGGSVLLYERARSLESDSLEAEFTRTAVDRFHLMQQGFTSYSDAHRQLALSASHSFLDNGMPMSREDFLQDALFVHETKTGLETVVLAPRIPGSKRAEFESYMQEQHNTSGLFVIGASGTGLPVPAPAADEYWPIAYSVLRPEIRDRTSQLTMVDLQAIPPAATLARPAIDTGVCPGTRLLSVIDQRRLLGIICPMYDQLPANATVEERRSRHAGFISVTFNVQELALSSIFSNTVDDLVAVVEVDTAEQNDTTNSLGLILLQADPETVLASLVSSPSTQGASNIDLAVAYKMIDDAGALVAVKVLSLANLSLKITIAALDSYTSKRATDGPQLLFALALALVLILFFSALAISLYLHAKERATAVVLLAKERAERDLADTARSAHEKTVAYACHQLRNPLHAVAGCAEFLREHIPPGGELYEDVNAIVLGCMQMHRLINDVLDWSRVQIGVLEVTPKPVNVRVLVESLAARHGPMVFPGVSLGVEVSVELPEYVMLDELRVSQVICNALANSIKATREGRITLRVWHSKPSNKGQFNLHVEVVDTGCGLGDVDPNTLFEPFFNGSSTRLTSKRRGFLGSRGSTPRPKYRSPKNLVTRLVPTSSFVDEKATPFSDGAAVAWPVGDAAGTIPSNGRPPTPHTPASGAVSVTAHSLDTGRGSVGFVRPTVTSSSLAVSRGPLSPSNAKSSLRKEKQNAVLRAAGIGLGLPISKQLVDLMKGEISICRDGPNTVLWFWIPVSRASAPGPSHANLSATNLLSGGSSRSLADRAASGTGVRGPRIPVPVSPRRAGASNGAHHGQGSILGRPSPRASGNLAGSRTGHGSNSNPHAGPVTAAGAGGVPNMGTASAGIHRASSVPTDTVPAVSRRYILDTSNGDHGDDGSGPRDPRMSSPARSPASSVHSGRSQHRASKAFEWEDGDASGHAGTSHSNNSERTTRYSASSFGSAVDPHHAVVSLSRKTSPRSAASYGRGVPSVSSPHRWSQAAPDHSSRPRISGDCAASSGTCPAPLLPFLPSVRPPPTDLWETSVDVDADAAAAAAAAAEVGASPVASSDGGRSTRSATSGLLSPAVPRTAPRYSDSQHSPESRLAVGDLNSRLRHAVSASPRHNPPASASHPGPPGTIRIHRTSSSCRSDSPAPATHGKAAWWPEGPSPDSREGPSLSALPTGDSRPSSSVRASRTIAPAATQFAGDSPVDVSGGHALVVDDEATNRRLCSRMLQRLGCTSVQLADGDQVFDALVQAGFVPNGRSPHADDVVAAENQRFTVVLLDIMMANTNGVDVLVDIQERFSASPVPLPPFVAMTGNTSLQDIQTYREAGFAYVLAKPFDVNALRTSIAMAPLCPLAASATPGHFPEDTSRADHDPVSHPSQDPGYPAAAHGSRSTGPEAV